MDDIIPTCREFEDQLIKLVWNRRRSTNLSLTSFPLSSSKATSNVNLTEKDKEQVDTKEVPPVPPLPAVRHGKKKRFFGLGSYFVTDKGDVEKTADGPSPRPIRLLAPIYNGLGVAMSICELLACSLSSPILSYTRRSLHRKRYLGTARGISARRKLDAICPSRHDALPLLCLAGTSSSAVISRRSSC